MNTTNSSHKAPVAIGFLAICGLAIELKHGIPAIFAPFLNCSGFIDFFVVLHHLSDAIFLGILAWIGILIVSLTIFIRLLMPYAFKTAVNLFR